MKRCTAIITVLALGWLAAAEAAAAQSLGRLFYTPQQRQFIDHRHQPLRQRPAQSRPRDTRYNGYVRRSDGKNTIWVNGQTRYVDQTMVNPGQLKLPATPALKPGQVFDRQAGRVLESYEMAEPEPPRITALPPRSSALPPLTDDRDEADGQADDAAAQ